MSFVHLCMFIGCILLGFAAGWVMHRSDYCVAGMFRDLFLFRSTFMLKTLLLLILVSIPLFEVARLTGSVKYPFPFFGTPSLANVLGGMLFGIGMVLAGGCVVGTLYKMGAGRFPSFLAFLGLVAGSTLYAEFHPYWSAFSHTLDLPTKAATVPQLLALPSWMISGPSFLVISLLVIRWFRRGQAVKPVVVDGYLQPWKAAVLLAGIGFLSVLLVGMPLGITTAYSKIGALLEQLLVPDHYDQVVYFGLSPLQYLPPLGGGLLRGGPGAALDGIALIQFPLIAGIILGAAFSARRLGEWRLQLNLPMRQVFSALLGGIAMGLASRMAPACNIWHLMGGLPIFAMQSILFLAGLLPGAWLGGILLSRLVLPR